MSGVWSRLRPGGAPPVLTTREAFELWAATYDSPPTELQRLEAEARGELMPSLAGARLLDVGCGVGRVAREALSRGAGAVVGVDASRAMLGRAASEQAASRAAWAAGDASRLPFRSACFDAAVCALVLAHLSDPGPAVSELARVVRPGGVVVVSDFHPAAARRGWERTFVEDGTGRSYRVEHHAHRFEDYRDALNRAGCRVDGHTERRYDGTPVVFALRATTPGGSEAECAC